MAIYHCDAQVIKRSNGQSAVGAAAYRSGEKITNEYDGITHDYTKKGGVVYSEIMLCENASQEYKNRSALWNAVEQNEKSAKAQLAREYNIALPRELSREENIQLLRDYVRDNFVNNGMCADFSIHDKGDGNPHAHIMLTMRPIEKDGTWGTKQRKEYILDKNGNKQFDKKKHTYKCRTVKTTNWDDVNFLENCREDLAVKINRELERKGLPDRVDHRSYEAQGVNKIPTIHKGKTAIEMENRGIEADRTREFRLIEKANSRIQNIDKAIKGTTHEYMAIKQDNDWTKLHEFSGKITDEVFKHPDNIAVQKKMLEGLSLLEQKANEVKGQPDYHAGEHYNFGASGKPGYSEYHIGKFELDRDYIRKSIEKNLAEIDRNRQAAQSGRANVQQAEPQKVSQVEGARTVNQASTYNVAAVARQLAAYRADFIRATAQAAGRTEYRENPIYRQRAAQIPKCVSTINYQTASIEHLKADRDRLGAFHGREKRELQVKIDNFVSLRADRLKELKELGVSEPSQAAEAIKKNKDLAASELEKVKAAQESRGAGGRAAEVKAAYHFIVPTIPGEYRQAVFDEYRRAVLSETQAIGVPGGKGMAAYQAEIAARHELDEKLTPPRAQTQEQERRQGQTRGMGGMER